MLEIKVTIGFDAETKELLKAYIQASKQPYIAGADFAKDTDHQVEPKPADKASSALQPLAEDDELAKTCPFDEDKKIDIEDVRATLASAKHTYGLDKIKPILKKYGKGDLASIPAEKYAALLDDIAKLGE